MMLIIACPTDHVSVLVGIGIIIGNLLWQVGSVKNIVQLNKGMMDVPCVLYKVIHSWSVYES